MKQEIYDFRQIVIESASRQLGIRYNHEEFSIKKAPHDRKRFRMALEFVGEKLAEQNPGRPKVRFRVYIDNIAAIRLTRIRLYEDPNFSTTPNDELYVCESSLPMSTFNALVGHFQNGIDDGDYQFYDIVLDMDGNPVLDMDGSYILYLT